MVMLDFSEKKTTVFFTRKRTEKGKKLRLYGNDLERVETFKFLGSGEQAVHL